MWIDSRSTWGSLIAKTGQLYEDLFEKYAYDLAEISKSKNKRNYINKYGWAPSFHFAWLSELDIYMRLGLGGNGTGCYK